ncbi:glycosyltransferase family protein [Desulfocurvus sp. DL9XJH121]
MDRLCWIGNPYFCEKMRAQGWDVALLERREARMVAWDEVVAACGGAPRAVVLGDASLPPILAGVESWPCLTAFHCVDSHIHSWHPLYARAFDLCSVSLRDHLPRFREAGMPEDSLWWLPPWAPDHTGPRAVDKEWDVLFAGTVDPATTPARHAFLGELKQRLPGLHVTRGDFGDLFPRARVVLNYCEAGDLNFRVFEALGTGACLATPRVGHGQDELFPDGRDLFTYPVDDMDALAALLTRLLEHPELGERAGASGLASVDAAHRASHRARALSERLRAVPASRPEARRALAPALRREILRPLYLHFAEALNNAPLRAAYLNLATAGR